jgi:hypothetical protein
MSGPAAGRGRAATAPLPARLLDAPFSRALRARTSGVLDALLAGRGWIALVGVLLVGIVFFNVDLLRKNRDIARTAERSAVLKRENARLRQEAALLGSSERIRDEAMALGLFMPGAGDVRYLAVRPASDARRAARRIVEPSGLAMAPIVPEPVPEPVTSAPVTATPPADPAAAEAGTAIPVATDPAAATAPAADAPAATAPVAPAPGTAVGEEAPTTVPPTG